MDLTHRRSNDALTDGYVVLFATRDNDHYGRYVWGVDPSALSDITDEAVSLCAKYYDIDADEARALVNPDRIVNSAGAWDDTDFVSYFCDTARNVPAGFLTDDGAVVFDTAICTFCPAG